MKKVVITGASSGIGAVLAETFSANGWQVLMIARNENRLQSLKNNLKNTDYVVCDLSSKTEIAACTADLLRFGPIDALINNAGIYVPCSVDADQDDVWDQQYTTNLLGPVRLTRIYWEQLKKSKGTILNISSTLAIRPVQNTSAYSALKAALNNWTLGLALEGGPHGINVNCICPGIIDTPIHSYHGRATHQEKEIHKAVQKLQPLGRIGQPQDIAPMALQLCGPGSEWITGSIINIDGGILLGDGKL